MTASDWQDTLCLIEDTASLRDCIQHYDEGWTLTRLVDYLKANHVPCEVYKGMPLPEALKRLVPQRTTTTYVVATTASEMAIPYSVYTLHPFFLLSLFLPTPFPTKEGILHQVRHKRSCIHAPWPDPKLYGHPLAGLSITLSNMEGMDRVLYKLLIAHLGATYSPDLRREVTTHVVTKTYVGNKVICAYQWGMEIVNPFWLEACLGTMSRHPVSDPIFGFQKAFGEATLYWQSHDAVLLMPGRAKQRLVRSEADTQAEEALQREPEASHSEKEEQKAPVQHIEEGTHHKTTVATEESVGTLEKVDEESKPAHATQSRPDEESTSICDGKETNILDQKDQEERTRAAITSDKGAAPEEEATGQESGEASREKSGEEVQSREEPSKAQEKPITHQQERITPRSKKRRLQEEEKATVAIVFSGEYKLGEKDKRALLALGVTLVHDVADATHLVANKISRTEKWLCAIGLRRHIVNTTWIKESIRAGEVQPSDRFLPKDSGMERKYGFSLAETVQLGNDAGVGLLHQMRMWVYIQDDIKAVAARHILEANGAKMWKPRQAHVESSHSFTLPNDVWVVLDAPVKNAGDENEGSVNGAFKAADFVARLSKMTANVVQLEDIVTAILRRERVKRD